jgi:hypothetical protein
VNWFSRLFGKRSEAPPSAPAAQSGQAQWRSNIISQSEIQIAGVTVTATIEGPGRGFVAVVGESHYQEALRAAKATQPLVDEPVVRASLVPEPTNPFDANAVAVHIEPFGTVGYLRRELAKTYSHALQQAGSAQCPAKLYGGTADKPSIGVVLDATQIEGPALFTDDPLAPPNYERIEEYHRLRNANRETVERTRALERQDPSAAADAYLGALDAMRAYERMAAEERLFPRLEQTGDVGILDRLTLCLIKASRDAEAVAIADEYFDAFPVALEGTTGRAIKARIDKRRRTRPPSPSKPRIRPETNARSTTPPLDAHGQPVNRQFNRLRRTERDISELLGLAKGMLVDGVITDKEATFLAAWGRNHPDALDTWPVDLIFQRLSTFFADGRIDDAERTELHDLLTSLVGGATTLVIGAEGSSTLPLDQPPPTIRWGANEVYVFSGRFAYGSRKHCESEAIVRQSVCEENVTKRTTFLVVGTFGSADWAQSNYGRKIQRAIELRSGGSPLHIVGEDRWVQALKTDPR